MDMPSHRQVRQVKAVHHLGTFASETMKVNVSLHKSMAAVDSCTIISSSECVHPLKVQHYSCLEHTPYAHCRGPHIVLLPYSACAKDTSNS